MKGRHFLSIHDLTQAEVMEVLQVAAGLKDKQKAGEPHLLLRGKTLGMVFQKASTRTRVSFEVAMRQLGGMALYLNGNDIQIGRGETIADTARVLSRYVDGIMIRTFAHSDVEELARYATVPVINGLTDLLHPCQVMADLFTIQEKKGRLAGLKLAYVGDGNNMAHSLMFGGAKVGMHVTVCTPPGYGPQSRIVELAREDARATGAVIDVTNDASVAVQGADIVYTDVWASMGQEAEHAERVKAFAGYQVNAVLMQQANPGALFMHCLPAHRGEEVAAEVIDGPQSVVFDEAENRLHVQKALLALLL